MDEVPTLGPEDDRRLFNEFKAQYDAPAFVRRARAVEQAYEHLLERCGAQRVQWLPMARLRLGQLHGLAGTWESLQPYLANAEQLAVLRQLEADLQPRLRLPVQPTTSPRTLRRALRELTESLERFNRRWYEYILGVPLAPINELRDGYNRYYLVEKECAVRSFRLAREGFQRLPPLTAVDLLAVFPPLPVPQRA